MSTALEQTGKKATALVQRARTVDEQMELLHADPRRAPTRAERELTTSSALTQFVIAALVLAIAVGGAVINFNLIALPMSEMVGGGSYIGAWKTSDVAALVIILVEVAMGLYLMESLRITRLFPVIGQMDDRTRRAHGLGHLLAAPGAGGHRVVAGLDARPHRRRHEGAAPVAGRRGRRRRRRPA